MAKYFITEIIIQISSGIMVITSFLLIFLYLQIIQALERVIIKGSKKDLQNYIYLIHFIY